MSLFLGRIHYIMYDKILFQEEILNKLMELLEEEKRKEKKKDLDDNFPLERGNLEDIIDESNIHGWLNERVIRSENRLAKAVSILLEDFDLEKLKNKFRLELVYVDERMTTLMAKDVLMEASVRRENRKKYVDKIAAAFILKTYMDSSDGGNDGKNSIL